VNAYGGTKDTKIKPESKDTEEYSKAVHDGLTKAENAKDSSDFWLYQIQSSILL
jgi:hypothetical protein